MQVDDLDDLEFRDESYYPSRHRKKKSMDDEEDQYLDRNLLVQIVAILALRLGYDAEWGVDPSEPDWPVLYIEMPGEMKQISFHIAKSDVYMIDLPNGSVVWDGHSTPEKRQRMISFIRSAGGLDKIER